MKGGKMGIITLFRAVFQVWHINSHIRSRHVNIRRCVCVHPLSAWLSGEELLFHKSGRAGADRLCTTFFHTLFFFLSSSPLLSLLSAVVDPITASSLIFVSFSNPLRQLFIFFHVFVLSLFSHFCHLICFFLLSISCLRLFYGPCHGSLIISASYIFI